MTRMVAILVWLTAVLSALAQEKQEKAILVLNSGGHADSIPIVLFTPNGRELVTVSKDKTIRIWSVATGEMIRVLRPPIGRGREGTLYAADITPDGRLLAVGGIGLEADKHPIYLASLATGLIERTLEGHAKTVVDVAFSADGKRLASGGEDNVARVWNFKTGACEQVFEGHTAPIYDVAWAPDNSHLATASLDGTARIWSLATGEASAVLRDAVEGRLYSLPSVTWSPDGKTIASGSFDQHIRLWNLDGSLRRRFGPFGDSIRSLMFTSDSTELLFTRGYNLRSDCSMLTLATGEERVRFTKHTSGVMQGTLSPDGALAATAGFLGEELFIWKASSGQLVHRLGGSSRTVWSAAWSPDGKQIAWGNQGKRAFSNDFHPLQRAFHLANLEWGETPDDRFQRAKTTRGPLSG